MAALFWQLVTLGTRTMKVKVLRVAKSLRSKDQWKQVYISADETKREREKQYQLRKELRDRRGNGEENLVIHRGQIVEADGKKMQGTQMKQNMENDDGSHRRKHQGGSPPGGAGQHLLHEKHHLFEGIASLK